MHLVVFRLLWCTLHSNQIAVGPADEEEVASQGPLLATRVSAYSRRKTWQKDPTKLPDDRYGILALQTHSACRAVRNDVNVLRS